MLFLQDPSSHYLNTYAIPEIFLLYIDKNSVSTSKLPTHAARGVYLILDTVS